MRISPVLVGLCGLLATGCAAAGASLSARLVEPESRETAAKPQTLPQQHTWLYVAGGNNVIDAYDVSRKGDPLVATITQGIDSPDGISIGPKGRLYVANPGNDTVTEYPFGEAVPIVTLSINAPVDALLDPVTLNTYVDTRGNPPGIAIYEPKATAPWKYVVSRLLQVPSQMLFDASGNLYIADNASGVLFVRAHTFHVVSLHLKHLDGCTTGLALDEANSELFVSDCNGGIQVYMLGYTYPQRSLVDSFPADYLAIGPVHAQVDLFAPDFSSDTVAVYHEASDNPFETIRTGAHPAVGVAIKPSGVPPD